ncbi:hypothetical protein [Methylobacterium gossipiicola]|uniref:Uncharacterized protein n=1 Tax=Methylobacterium gossipiicola TaxID=582675 RepID=A0A1I2TPK7_9HYPH|nr:hypothetical protein [Methylobacterium gossipiicola]SFG65307.1 hypothetical protein SAMN05192565_107171 [Methylobacterium gossipiicola]
MSAALALPTEAKRIVEAWRAGVRSLPVLAPPCRGMTSAGWPGVRAGMLEFLDTSGLDAVRMGFGTRALFGVHRLAAALRVDSCGVLVMVTWVPIARMEPGVIRLANGLVSRGMTNPDESIPIWKFGDSPTRGR